MADLRPAKVVAVHPGGYAVDLVFLDDGSRVPAVQCLTPFASTNSGIADLPAPTPGQSAYDASETKIRDIYAMCGSFRGLPVVVGFLFPQVCQMLFDDANRRIDRHASDVYTSIDGDGNVELYHPSGTYLRIGTAAAHEDLTGKDFDGKWKITNNTDKAVYVHLGVANGGNSVASIDIDPSGNITTQNNGNLTATVGGGATVNVTGNAAIQASGAVTIQGSTVSLN